MNTLPLSTSAARPAAPDGSAMTRFLRELFLRLLRRRRNVRAITHLESLDDHLLADIGLRRDQVSAVIGDRHRIRRRHPTSLW